MIPKRRITIYKEKYCMHERVSNWAQNVMKSIMYIWEASHVFWWYPYIILSERLWFDSHETLSDNDLITIYWSNQHVEGLGVKVLNVEETYTPIRYEIEISAQNLYCGLFGKFIKPCCTWSYSTLLIIVWQIPHNENSIQKSQNSSVHIFDTRERSWI